MILKGVRADLLGLRGAMYLWSMERYSSLLFLFSIVSTLIKWRQLSYAEKKIKYDLSSFQCNSLIDIICDVFSYHFGKFWWEKYAHHSYCCQILRGRTSSTLVWVQSGAKVPAELRLRMQCIRSYQLMSRITYQCYSGCALTGIQTERSI